MKQLETGIIQQLFTEVEVASTGGWYWTDTEVNNCLSIY